MPIPLPCSNYLVAARKESDAVEGSTILRGDLDTERGQMFSRIGHEALAAGLVDRRPKSIGDQNIQTFLPECDGGGEASGAATDNECVTKDHSAPPPTIPAVTSRSKIPAPSPPARCVILAWGADES